MADAAGKHFMCGDDVRLLRAASAVQPWQAPKIMDAWDEISQRLRDSPQFPQDKDGKALSSRFSLLLKKHRDNTLASMRKSGREEEFRQRERLLDDISLTISRFKVLKAEEKSLRGIEKRRRDTNGSTAFRAIEEDACEVVQSEFNGSEESDADLRPRKRPVARSDAVGVGDDRLSSLEERKLELLKRQLDQQQQQLDLQQQQLNLQREQFERQFQLQQRQMHEFLQLVDRLTRK